MQFRLRTLFTATAGVAFILGLWRLLGDRFGLLLIIVELAIPLVWRPRWFYSWFLPLVWTTIAWNNFYHPGDEYGGFAGGSLAGLWIIAVVGGVSSVHRGAILLITAGAGSMAIVGWLLDKLRAPLIPLACLFLMTATGLFAWTFGQFPSVERALGKMGSYEAFILPSLNVGLTFAVVVTLVGTGLYRLVKRFRKGAPGQASNM